MLNKGSFLVVMALFCLMALTGWYAAGLTRLPTLPDVGAFNMGVLTTAHVVQTTDTGALQYQGDMAEATQINNGDIHFKGLNILFYNTENDITPWNLKADRGTAIDRNTEIDLQGNVALSRAVTANSAPILVQTAAAMIYPNSQKVTGEGLITLSQPGTMNQTTGVGFVVNLQQKTANLLSQVKSIYAPR